MMAAAEAGRDVCYFTYGDDDMVDQLASVYKFLHDCRLTVGEHGCLLIISKFHAKVFVCWYPRQFFGKPIR